MQRERGLTLIELMIVVAIIGILVAIAVPNFVRFQALSRQSEAKINLKSIARATQAVYAERGTLNCGFCGWRPEGNNRYHYYAGNGNNLTTGTHGGNEGNCAGAGWSAAAQATDGHFTATAVGTIDDDLTMDCWLVNDANDLTLIQDDVLL